MRTTSRPSRHSSLLSESRVPWTQTATSRARRCGTFFTVIGIFCSAAAAVVILASVADDVIFFRISTAEAEVFSVSSYGAVATTVLITEAAASCVVVAAAAFLDRCRSRVADSVASDAFLPPTPLRLLFFLPLSLRYRCYCCCVHGRIHPLFPISRFGHRHRCDFKFCFLGSRRR